MTEIPTTPILNSDIQLFVKRGFNHDGSVDDRHLTVGWRTFWEDPKLKEKIENEHKKAAKKAEKDGGTPPNLNPGYGYRCFGDWMPVPFVGDARKDAAEVAFAVSYLWEGAARVNTELLSGEMGEVSKELEIETGNDAATTASNKYHSRFSEKGFFSRLMSVFQRRALFRGSPKNDLQS